MLYWKTRDSKVALNELTSSDGGTGANYDIVVDQTYNPGSSNAQAGVAVAQAVSQLEQQIAQKYDAVLQYKGSKPSVNDLPQTGNSKGDVWNVSDTDANYAWDGQKWDKLSEDLTGVVTKTELNNLTTAFNNHKANQDTDSKHLNAQQYSNFSRMELFTRDEVKGFIGNALDDYIATGELVTKESLQSKLNSMESTVQTNVLNSVSGTVSTSYVSVTDFNNYKNQQSSLFGQYIKCSSHDELKVYTTATALPALGQRQANIIYLVTTT